LCSKNQEPISTFHDESFVSYTETQLDDLYRKTKKINNTLKGLDEKLDDTHESIQHQKIEKSKNKKTKDLYINTR